MSPAKLPEMLTVLLRKSVLIKGLMLPRITAGTCSRTRHEISLLRMNNFVLPFKYFYSPLLFCSILGRSSFLGWSNQLASMTAPHYRPRDEENDSSQDHNDGDHDNDGNQKQKVIGSCCMLHLLVLQPWEALLTINYSNSIVSHLSTVVKGTNSGAIGAALVLPESLLFPPS